MSEETNAVASGRTSPADIEAGLGLAPARRVALFDVPAEPLHKRSRLVDKADRYCWICVDDTPGKSSLLCDLCPRLFHCRCLGLTSTSRVQQWICPECERILRAECPLTRSRAMKLISCDELCKLLKYALERARTNLNAEFLHPVDAEQVPQYKEFIVFPCDISTIEKNIDQKLYVCTEAFLSDVKWIQHNSTIFNGPQHSLTTNARSLVRQCKREVKDIEVCPECYRNVFANPAEADWFCQPCKNPHPLVWAKLKGYPFWPAKALREADGVVDVRFFGAHDRSWVALNQVYLLSKECPGPVKGRKAGFDAAMRELELHITKLREKYGKYEYAPLRTPYASTLAGCAAAPSISPSITGTQQQPRRKRAQRHFGTAADAAACSSSKSAAVGSGAVPSRPRRTSVKVPSASPRSSRTQRLASKHHLFIKHSVNGVESGRSEADGDDESRSPAAGAVGLESLVDAGVAATSPALTAEPESSEGGDLDCPAADDCERSSPLVSSALSESVTSLSLLPTNGRGDCSANESSMLVDGEASLVSEQAASGSTKRDKSVTEKEMDDCPPEDCDRQMAHCGEKADLANSQGCSRVCQTEVPVSALKAAEDDGVPSPATSSSCRAPAVLQKTSRPLPTGEPTATVPIDSCVRHGDREAEQQLLDDVAGEAGLARSNSAVRIGDTVARNLPSCNTAAAVTSSNAFNTLTPSPISGSAAAACTESGALVPGMRQHNDNSHCESHDSIAGDRSCLRPAPASSAEPVAERMTEVPVIAASEPLPPSAVPEQPPLPAKRCIPTADAAAGVAGTLGEMLALDAELQQNSEDDDKSVGSMSAKAEEATAVAGADRTSLEQPSRTTIVQVDHVDSGEVVDELAKGAAASVAADSWFENLEKTIEDVRAQLYGDGRQSFEPCDDSGSDEDEDDDRRSSQSEMSFGNAACEQVHQWPPTDGDTAQQPTEPMEASTSGEAPILSFTPSTCIVDEKSQCGDAEVKQEAAITVTKVCNAPGRSVLASTALKKEPVESAQLASNVIASTNSSDTSSPIPATGRPGTSGRLLPTAIRSVMSPVGCGVAADVEPTILPPAAKRKFVALDAELATPATDTSATTARVIEEQLDRMQSQYRRSVSAMKHNYGLLLEEVRKVAEQDKLRALAKAKRQADERMQHAVEDAKCKQWCANCHREAQLYCCWNTSYCDYPCQQLHWSQHMQSCTQVSPQALADASVGYTDCGENDANMQDGEVDESVSLLADTINASQSVMASALGRSPAVMSVQSVSSAVVRQQPRSKQQSGGGRRRASAAANGEPLRSATEHAPLPLSSADSHRGIKVPAGSAASVDRSLHQSSASPLEGSLKVSQSGLVGMAAPARPRTLLTHDYISNSDTLLQASARHQATASSVRAAVRHAHLASETGASAAKQHAAVRSADTSSRDTTITFGLPPTSRAGGSSTLIVARNSSPLPVSVAVRSNSAAATTFVPAKAEPSVETTISASASAARATSIPMPYFRAQTTVRSIPGQKRSQSGATGSQLAGRGSKQSFSSGR